MLSMLATCERWDNSSIREKEQLAVEVEHALVAPRLRFEGLHTYSLGTQTHTIAHYVYNESQFALLPGYSGLLGYDSRTHPAPEDLRIDDASDTDAAPIRDYLSVFAKELTPLRQVSVSPFLIAVTAVPLRAYQLGADGRWSSGGEPIRRSEVLADVSQEGCRFPTNDEWEYACSGGSRTFFRWGNYWPPMRWAPPTRRAPSEWREDVMPNAFGLLIGLDPQNVEYCAEADTVRGGDGGSALSIGVGLREEWLSFATSYRYPFSADFIGRLRSPYLRRALSLPGSLVL